MIHPCGSGDQNLGAYGASGWETVTVQVNTLVAGGLDLSKVNTGFVIWATNKTSTFQVDNVQWNEGDGGVIEDVSVTFQVDMSGVDTGVSADGVYIAGGAFGQEGHLLTDGGNGVWSVTVEVVPGGQYTYKFRNQAANGGWDGFEDAAGLVAGECNSGEYNDRVVSVGDTDLVLDVVAYGSCTAEPYVAPSGPTLPTAPVPTDAAETVLSVFGTTYGTLEGTNFNPGWGQSTAVEVGDNLAYSNLNYQGTQFANALDVSGYEYLNVDYYVTESTALNFFMISDGAETSYALDVAQVDQWVSVQIPLSAYSDVVNLEAVIQFKVDGNGTVAFNNVYFGGTAPVETSTVSLTLTTDGSAVRMTGPWWSWDANGGPEAVDNGDGTWTVTLDPAPTDNMEYLWVVDGVQENLIDNAAGAECTAEIDAGALITDYSGWANRVLVLDSGDASNTYDACAGTAAPSTGVDLTLTTDGSAVRMTGPWWSWDANGGPEAVDNGDGTWTVTLDPAPTENMEYLWVVDGVQENLIDNAAGAECSAEIDAGALITDYSGWANRVLVLDSGDASNTYDACAGTAAPSTGLALTLTTDGSAVRMTGPWWSWDPNGGPEAVDNGDGTWTVTLDPAPTDNMEYLWVVDGVQENLIDNAANAECSAEIDAGALITDYFSYGNRVHVLDSGDVSNTYDACAGTAGPEPVAFNPLVIDNGVADAYYDRGLVAFDEALGWADCDPAADCTSVTTSVVNDADRGDVLQIAHDETANLAGVFAGLSEGSDFSAYAGGTITFDVKTVSGDSDITMKIDCGHPCGSGDQNLGAYGASGWETVTVQVNTLVAGGLDLSKVNTGFVIWATNKTSTFQVDNVQWNEGDGGVIEDVSVTFQVDMSGVDTGVSADGVYIAGGAFGQEGHLLTDGGNGVWSVTVEVVPGGQYTYKFRNQAANGGWDGFEDAAGLVAGECNSGEYNDRVVSVGDTDLVLDVVAYGSCTAEPYVAPSGPTLPTAPVPTDAAETVLSVFGTTYGTLEGTNFNPGWGQSTAVEVGDNLAYSNLNYQGTQFANALDVSGYEYLNVDYYVTESTALNFFMISDGAETSYALDVAQVDQWVSVQIPLSAYSDVVNLEAVIQFKVDGNGTVAFNNVYFGGTAPVETSTVSLTLTTDGSAVRMTGPWWSWDANGGPEAVDNGDGTWTVTLDPAPTDNMEYLWVVDGVQENLIDNAAGAECSAEIDAGALITDYSGWANRVLVLDSGDASNTYDACAGTAAPSTGVDLTLTTDGSAVRMTGPWWSWDANGGPEAVDNGDGTWTVTLDPAPTENMEYLWVVDGVQENLIDNAAGAECSAEIDAGALITDYSGWANRVLVLDSGDASNTYDACAGTAAPSTGLALTLTTDGSAVRMTGPWWSWDPNGGPEAVDNGDGTWTVTLDPAPTDNMEYLWVVDGVQENLIDNAANAECSAEIDAGALITDYFSYGNRVHVLDSGDVSNTYDACAGTAGPEPVAFNPLVIDNGVADAYYDRGLVAFDEALGWADCDPAADCTSVTTSVVNDADRGDVLQIAHDETANLAGVFAGLSEGSDFSAYAGGTITFDVKTVSGDSDITMKIDCGHPCGSGDQNLGAYGASGWETVTVQVNTLVAGGLDLSKVNTGFVIWATNKTSTFQVDNVQWNEGDGGVIEDVSVTFQVDMSGVDTGVSADGVYIAGGAFGQEGHLLTDGGNGVWSVTVEVVPGGQYTYKFRNQAANGGWDGFEDAAGLVAGECNSGEYNDRVVSVGDTDLVLDVVAYGSCTAEPYVAPSGPTLPTAPVPTDAAETVLSVFGTTYGTLEGTNFNPGWGQSTAVEVGDNLAYSNLNYQGTQFANALDVSGYEYLNVDYYVTESTALNFFMISDGAETSYALDVAQVDQWVSVQIPLSAYSDVVNLEAVIQFKVDGNGTVAFNNVYFGGTAPVETSTVSLTLTTDGSAVRMTGPWWSWDANGGPEAVDNGDGTWTVTLDPAPTDNMEYLWVVDGVQENLIDNAAGAECSAEIDAGALITDYSGWANRVLVLDSGDASNTYDACAGTAAPSTGVDLTLTTDGSAVRMTGPWWSWDANGGPEAVDNGDGTWTVTLDPAPTDNMEYLWVVDGVQENLIDNAAGAECSAEIDAWLTDH